MRSAPCPPVAAAVLAAVIAACAQAQPASSVSSGPATQPDDAAELALLNWLGPQYSLASTRNFTLIRGRTVWPAGFEGRLEAFCDGFVSVLGDAGFPVSYPKDPLIWIGFDDRDKFDCYVARWERMDLSRLDGYYSTRTNRVATMMPQPASRRSTSQPADETAAVGVSLIHEAAHQLSFNCGLLKRGVMYPLWVSEGVATNFEVGPGRKLQDNPARCGRLMDVRAGCELTPLSELAVATRPPEDRDEALQIYAESWGLFRFLLEDRREGLKRYLTQAAGLPAGKRPAETMQAEFEAAFGPIEQLDGPWAGFLAGLDRRKQVDAVPPGGAEP